jgi:hypothetical protein
LLILPAAVLGNVDHDDALRRLLPGNAKIAEMLPDLVEQQQFLDLANGDVLNAPGIPRPCDEGAMRYDNMTHLVAGWMGDDAVLREIAVQLRAPALVGDLSWCTGEVVAKREEDGRKLVELYIWITNQRDERTTVARPLSSSRPAAGRRAAWRASCQAASHGRRVPDESPRP